MITFNLNGNILTDERLYLPIELNGSFWYGDGFFDAMVFVNGNIHFRDLHWDRLVHSCQLLQINNPFANEDAFGNNVKLLANLTPDEARRIKLMVWRHSHQGYKPADAASEFLITTSPLHSEPYKLNINGLRLVTYTDNLKSFSPLGNVKSTSSALYVLATQYAQSRQADDALIFNTYHRPIETAGMNIYLVKGDTILTPGLDEGCLDGIMRRVMITICREKGIDLIERPIEHADIDQSEGILLSNTIKGIQWVNKLNHRVFDLPPVVIHLNEWLSTLEK